MDHAEVRAWLEEAFFRPGALRRLEEDGEHDGEAAVIRRHLQGCAACMSELRALRATSVALDVGLGPSPAAGGRMLANVRSLGRQRPVPSGSALVSVTRRLSLLRAAAVVALAALAFASGALLGLGWPAQEPTDGPQLAHAAAMMGELLAEPDTRQLQLLDSAGEPAGIVVHSPSRQQLAVLTSVLEQPTTGRYECYLERDGESVFIGPMNFEGGTAFWAGPVASLHDAGRTGDRFMVMHGPDAEPALWGQY